MTAEVVDLMPAINDIPRMLRELADEIERGETVPQFVVAVIVTETRDGLQWRGHEVEPRAYGRCSPMECCGAMMYAAGRLSG